MTANPVSRIKQLDVLRGIAIVLVLGSHMYATDLWSQIGWVGVDLFFVLSGFLVSGLLFKEYKEYGQIRLGRFLIRRGFKIYPAFYFFILVTIAIRLKYTQQVPIQTIIAEIFFLQNYLQPLWWHTWSLAVEEHFYLLLAILCFCLRRSSDGRNLFRHIPKITMFVALLVLGLRVLTTIYLTPWNLETHNQPTHLRIDSLLFGVLLAYYHHFNQTEFFNFIHQRARTIFFTSCLLCSSCLFFPGSHIFMTTIGFTLLYLGFGGIMMTSLYHTLTLPGPLAKLAALLGRALSYIGVYSYSIYLWHLLIAGVVIDVIRRISPIKLHYLAEFFIYATGSIVAGIFMSKLIEQPFLKWRDKLCPKKWQAENRPRPMQARQI
jgi:peptidoglycan/LPS O-acetylase OafA/YrhL